MSPTQSSPVLNPFLKYAGDAPQYFLSQWPFELESGNALPVLQLAYHTYGKLNGSADNVIWVCHALTANSDVAQWWPGMVGSGCPFDTDNYFVVCVNMPSSCYGSTGPCSLNPATGLAYGSDFPRLTIRDMVRAYQLLAGHLGIRRIVLLVGGSMGGQQALEWAVQQPGFIDRLAVLATNSRHSAWGQAFNATQRMAIEADPTYYDPSPTAGGAGLEAARATAILSYRSYAAYAETQTHSDENAVEVYRAESYQRHQGKKLRMRFNAHSYAALTKAMDSHHLGRNRGSGSELAALSGIEIPTLVIGLTTDILFPITEQQILESNIPNARLEVITSKYGHDGFLVETETIGHLIRDFLLES